MSRIDNSLEEHHTQSTETVTSPVSPSRRTGRPDVARAVDSVHPGIALAFCVKSQLLHTLQRPGTNKTLEKAPIRNVGQKMTATATTTMRRFLGRRCARGASKLGILPLSREAVLTIGAAANQKRLATNIRLFCSQNNGGR